ncbi:MAG: ATP-binding protein [Bauldia sp.]|uniref:ATP-binding protein n=1 Tax=Bauldia sp. TaxID=2575872 RepID=UPI001D6CD4D1|nr:ATP-binding protein [Bauldia sp.]MCB1497250.1 ATP-binding protein [Bauldia sp.]
MPHHDREHPIGLVTSVNGSQATARLDAAASTGPGAARLTIGRLVAMQTHHSRVVGVLARLVAQPNGDGADLLADIDLLGEIRNHGQPSAFFQRGVTDYPTIGDHLAEIGPEELRLIHRIAGGETIEVGRLQLDSSIPAYVNFDEMLHKHFAVLGTTGVGKSTSVSLILNEILDKDTNLRILLIDPHNEYAGCFGEKAKVISPKNLRLPYWLFNFEEIVDVFFRGRPGVEEETEILGELIPAAKAQYASNRNDRGLVRRVASGHTADTPIPYRISDLVSLIKERMGKLENRSSWTKYQRLVSRIESLGHDSRYAFMFDNLFVDDIMTGVISELFRLPPEGQPITVMQLAGFPSEVVDSVVSVLCRMAFDFGTWSDGAAPILVACEEAHRYVPADRRLGFGPTRKALSRIAKEGRKYGVYLAAVTQRPAELDPTILSQCSTVFAMRMSNDRDQAIVQSAIPDAGSSLLDFLPSLGTAEAIAFGEGVALPTRFHFSEVPPDRIPLSRAGEHDREFESVGEIDLGFIDAVVDRWRDATTSTPRPRLSVVDSDAGKAGWMDTAQYVPDPADFR